MDVDAELIVHRKPSHSDYLIHWTGDDIAKTFGLTRVAEPRYEQDVVDAYLERLYNILRFGLWLKKSKEPGVIEVSNQKIKKPNVPRLCFTELKVSDSILHARKFGALGIGVKRYYLFNRLGGPMHYVHKTPNLFLPPLGDAFNENSENYELLSFLRT